MRTPYKVGIVALAVYAVGVIVLLGLYAPKEINENVYRREKEVHRTGEMIVAMNVLQVVFCLVGVRILVLASREDDTDLGWLRRTMRWIPIAFVLLVLIGTYFGNQLVYPCPVTRSECLRPVTPLYIPFMFFGPFAVIGALAFVVFVAIIPCLPRHDNVRLHPSATDSAGADTQSHV